MNFIENVELCFSKKEFYLLYSAIVEISEEYHKPIPPEVTIEEKFGQSLTIVDKLITDLKKTKCKNDNVMIIKVKYVFYEFFYLILKDIINHYEYYEFQTITGFYKQDVEDVLKKIQKHKRC